MNEWLRTRLSATMSHEIGHNLGLHHGVGDVMKGRVDGGCPDPEPGAVKRPAIDDVCGLAAIQGTLELHCPLLLSGSGRRIVSSGSVVALIFVAAPYDMFPHPDLKVLAGELARL